MIILQLHRMVLLDTTGLLALSALNARLAENGRTLVLCGAAPEMQGLMEGSRLAEEVGADNLQPDLTTALERARALLTPAA